MGKEYDIIGRLLDADEDSKDGSWTILVSEATNLTVSLKKGNAKWVKFDCEYTGNRRAYVFLLFAGEPKAARTGTTKEAVPESQKMGRKLRK